MQDKKNRLNFYETVKHTELKLQSCNQQCLLQFVLVNAQVLSSMEMVCH